MDIIFTSQCSKNITDLLSPHEMCILVLLQYCFSKDSMNTCAFNFERLFDISVKKSRLYPVLMLRIYAKVNIDEILASSSRFNEMLKFYKGPYLLDLFIHEKNCIECNNGKPSPMHEIIWNDRNIHRNIDIIGLLLKFKASFLDQCFDKDGYNVLHRAAMGGNVNALKILFVIGVDIFKKSLKNETALDIVIEHSPYLMEGQAPFYYFKQEHSQVLRYHRENKREDIRVQEIPMIDFDESSVLILDKMFNRADGRKINILKHRLCPEKVKSLGLLHVSAAKGFKVFLKKCRTLFGFEVLKCSNVHNISENDY